MLLRYSFSLRGKTACGYKQAARSDWISTKQLLNLWPTGSHIPMLHLYFYYGFLKSECITMGNNINTTIRAFRAYAYLITHRFK
ncbi:hypothetical protein D3C76_1395070 [compost metagenome]